MERNKSGSVCCLGFFRLFYWLSGKLHRVQGFRKSYSAGSYGCRFCFWHLLISGELWQHVKVSAGRALLGLFIGGGLGLLLGLLNGSSRFASTLLDTTLQMIRNIPALALIPLVILWFGIDETAKLFLVAVGVFFLFISTPITVSVQSIHN